MAGTFQALQAATQTQAPVQTALANATALALTLTGISAQATSSQLAEFTQTAAAAATGAVQTPTAAAQDFLAQTITAIAGFSQATAVAASQTADAADTALRQTQTAIPLGMSQTAAAQDHLGQTITAIAGLSQATAVAASQTADAADAALRQTITAIPLMATQTALASGPTDTPIPPVTATPAIVCTGSPPQRLAVGMQGRVTPGDSNNFRDAPEGTILGQIPGGASFTVLDGPACGARSQLTWWKISYAGSSGWTPEGQGTTYWLEPAMIALTPDACSGSPAARLFIGATARVLPGRANSLRDNPEGDLVARILAGDTLTVLDGPRCGSTGRLRWWYVNYKGQNGWTAEGQGSVYWLEPAR